VETEGDAVAPSSRDTDGHGVVLEVEEEEGEADRVSAEGLEVTVGFRENEGAPVFSSFSSADDGLDVSVVVMSLVASEDDIGLSVGRRENEGGAVSSSRSPVGCSVSVGPGETDGDPHALSALYTEGLAVVVGIGDDDGDDVASSAPRPPWPVVADESDGRSVVVGMSDFDGCGDCEGVTDGTVSVGCTDFS
jgi:hypothetical protein